MPEGGTRYWAFLSYSRDDSGWAVWLHRALEGYAVPRRLVGRPTPAGPAPPRLRPIFRDRDELGAAPDLSERLQAALAASAWLVVLCSPSAARSRWVEEEIRQFKALHGEDRILAVIVGGKPFASDNPAEAHLECFPLALRQSFEVGPDGPERVEPAAADLRPGGDGRRLGLLKLLAGLLQVELDEIVQRDVLRRQQQLLALSVASLAAAGLMGAMALIAIRERNEALAQRAQAEGLIEFMIGDLRKRLEPAGRLDALNAIGERALTYYRTQQNRGVDAEVLGRRARVLHLLGSTREQGGDLPAASAFYQEAAQSTAELLARHPNDPQRIFDHAQSAYYVGEVALQRGEDSSALQHFEVYRQLADRLVAIDPRNQDWLAEAGEANTNVGVVLLRQRRAGEAVGVFEHALTLSARLAVAQPASRDRQWDLAQIHAWLADANVAGDHLDEALAHRASEARILKRLVDLSANDTGAAVALAASRTASAKVRLAQGAGAEAIAELQQAAADMDRLMALAPDNALFRTKAARTFLLLSQAQLEAGRLEPAGALARRTATMADAETAGARTPGEQGIFWQGAIMGGARAQAMKVAAEAAASREGQVQALAGAASEARRLAALSDARTGSASLAFAAAEAAILAGDHASLQGDVAGALAWWRYGDRAIRRAKPELLPKSDRSQTLLRQLVFRLRFDRPATGPMPANTAQPELRRSGTLVDYRW